MNFPEHAGPIDVVARSMNGTVARCPDCGSLELRFGNMLLRLEAGDLPRVQNAVGASVRKCIGESERVPTRARPVHIYIGESGAGFSFSFIEVTELQSLLDSAMHFMARSYPANESSTRRPLARLPRLT